MRGKVFLVGAGPGDPGLITMKGLEALRDADVVVYDRLVNEALLAEARPEAELVFAGASLRRNPNRQADINAMLVALRRSGEASGATQRWGPLRFRARRRRGQGACRAGRRFRGGARHHVGDRRTGVCRHSRH